MDGLFSDRDEEIRFERDYIKYMYGFYGYGMWNVYDKASGELIGRAGLTNRSGFEDIELGYLLSKKYRGRGIAYEVCLAIIGYAAAVLGSACLNAFIDEKNLRSGPVCIRCYPVLLS